MVTSGRVPGRAKGALSWLLAVCALAFVAWAVPIRDRCWDERTPAHTQVAVSRDSDRCVLHLRSGDVTIDAAECSQLRCDPGLASTLKHAQVGVIAALLLLYVAGTAAWAVRWRILLGFAEIDLPLLEVWRITIEAQAGGVLLPGGVGGDALRIAWVTSRPTRRGEPAPVALVAAAVLLDRAVGLTLIATVAVAMGAAFGGIGGGPLVWALTALPVAIVAGLAIVRLAPVERLPLLSGGRVGRALAPVLAYVRDPRAPRAIALAAAVSALIAAAQFIILRGLVFALGATPTAEKWVYVGTAMAFIVGAVPALPGGWGTSDAAYVFFFARAGLSPAIALAACLIYRLFWYILAVAGALLYASRPRPAVLARGAVDPPGEA
jgi:glycosyltransferase 2 family protein